MRIYLLLASSSYFKQQDPVSFKKAGYHKTRNSFSNQLYIGLFYIICSKIFPYFSLCFNFSLIKSWCNTYTLANLKIVFKIVTRYTVTILIIAKAFFLPLLLEEIWILFFVYMQPWETLIFVIQWLPSRKETRLFFLFFIF